MKQIKQMTEPDRRVVMSEALKLFSLSHDTIERRVKRGELPTPHRDGRRRFWLLSELWPFLASSDE